jgi:hypothetical protein
MKNFKSFIQLDEIERVKYKDATSNKMAAISYLAQTKDPGDLEKVGPEEVGPHDTKKGSGKRPADRLDNKQPFGEAESHQSKTTMKHIDNPNAAEKKAAKDIKPGIKGVKDRLAMLQAAKDRGALKNEQSNMPFDGPYKKSTGDVKDKSGAVHTSASKAKDLAQKGLKSVQDKIKSKVKENFDVEMLFNLYDNLDESNQEIFLNQLEEDAEVLLAFAKTIAEE